MENALTFEDEFEEIAVNYIGKPLFPIFRDDIQFLCVVGDIEKQKDSPIIFVSELREITIRYASLTSMMLTLAESFETGAAYVTSEFLTYSEERFSPIIENITPGC